ncbi:MAG: ATP-binding cassette domain-containing protein [Clostridium sp.]|nr:ATP-binding cassette domain-containing protein [Clostridium sp.]
MNKKTKDGLAGIGIVIFWLVVWQLAAFFVHNRILIAGPAETLQALVREAVTVSFWKTVVISVSRVTIGFLAAFFAGCLLAVFSFKSSMVQRLLAPVMQFAKAVPVASFVVILLIWRGADSLSVAISFLVTLPIVYVSFLEGLTHVDKNLMEMAQVYHLRFPVRALYIVRPALAPFLEGALQTALGMSFKAGVAAEVIGTPRWAIGSALYESKIYLDTAGVFAWTAVVVVLSFLLERLFLFFFRKLRNWQPFLAGKEQEYPAEDVKVCGLFRGYGGKQVLRDVNAHYRKGKIYCLMAPSGAGKTTLLLTMAGIYPPEKGSISGCRYPSVLFQEDRLLPKATVLQNAAVAAGEEKARNILSDLGLSDVFLQKTEELSGGMKRRACLARALAYGGDCLLLDEPFTGLDEENRKKAADCIRKYANGRMVLISTHDGEDASLLDGETVKLEK